MEVKWRKDLKCGWSNPLPDGNPTECDPDGIYPCCSYADGGYCGNTTDDCFSYYSVNYTFEREVERKWEESGGKIKWRKDKKCGSYFPLPDGNPTECDPDGIYPCCSYADGGYCGNTTDDCSSYYSVNYTFKREFKREWEESGGKIKWRKDKKCGSYFPLPDGNPTECDPDGIYPCCSNVNGGYCGNTTDDCSSYYSVNYTFEREVKRKWEESGGKIKWRKDLKCGWRNHLPDGNPTECDPDGINPCCSLPFGGYCGNTIDDCSALVSVNYTFKREFERKWEESGGKIKWRKDKKCGSLSPLPDGNPTECDPDGIYPCCSYADGGYCGNTTYDCSSYYSVNYTFKREFKREWEESGGKIKWRKDGKCGSSYRLPDGNPTECDPDGVYPCCGDNGYRQVKCGNADVTPHYCLQSDSVDYRVVHELRKSEENCTLTAVGSFIKNVCFDERRVYNFKCHNSNIHYYKHNERSISSVCDNDPYMYQACGLFNTDITNTDVLCGGFFCGKRYIKCGENCKIDCSASQNNEDSAISLCDDKCDVDSTCEDESDCNGYKYGIYCKYTKKFISVSRICGKFGYCEDGEDEKNCNTTTYTAPNMTLNTCTHFMGTIYFGPRTVPIFNYTRCSLFDMTKGIYPYCLDYMDQTNCSDIERVGGYCLINGFNSSVSKYMVCYADDANVKLCDDDIQKTCISPSTSIKCKVHKHKMCDTVLDCSDGSDEFHDICEYSKFQCVRRFNTNSKLEIPVSWIMDNETDCMDGMDEQVENLKFCGNKTDKSYRLNDSDEGCKNVYLCPRGDNTYVQFKQLCDGVESCGDGAENEVCRISRDFPTIKKTAGIYKEKIRNVCIGSSCKVEEFIRPWGDIYGELGIYLYAPISKVNCSGLFGEDYLLLSCMDLCLDATCPLNNRTLVYDSCPGQYLDRVYTLANSSFVTFVDKSEEGQYHQDYFQCNNTRCVDYEQVCDLTDDCGDMSDELNCTNHMICEDTLKQKSTKYQFISLSQRCDGIYDCFDLSDECNDACGKKILKNLVMQILCWIMGILALIFNAYTVFRGLKSIRYSKTGTSLVNKALVILIGSGDLFLGLYLVILSVYDSFIYGNEFCRHQAKWMTGTECSILGVISTVGSQVSLFAMTALSFIRMYGLTFKKMRIPGPANKSSVVKLVLLVSGIITASLAIAVIPLIPSMEEYFVQGMYYDPSFEVFVGFPNKVKHVKILQSHYNTTSTAEALNNNISMDMTWKEIGDKIDGMFNQQYGMLSRRPVHFYGNDGICLFKYFVRSDDARQNRQSFGIGTDPVVWLMLGVNLVCFITIACCYIVIIIETRISSRRSGQEHNPDRARDIRATQNKITIIVATDFLCWVPFIFICGMHNWDVFDASKWYVTYAMIALPINSVVNPLIYEKTLTDFLERRLNEVTTIIRLIATTVITLIPKAFRIKRNEASQINEINGPEIIQMVYLREHE